MPQAVFERQGKTLRTFREWDEAAGTQMLQSFAAAFRGKTLFAGIKRVVVKEYPAESAEALAEQALSGNAGLCPVSATRRKCGGEYDIHTFF